jgi:hypothetical protein
MLIVFTSGDPLVELNQPKFIAEVFNISINLLLVYFGSLGSLGKEGALKVFILVLKAEGLQ